MAKTNLQKLKEMYEKSKKGAALGDLYWKPKNGENIIRILPPKDDNEIPYYETAVHSFGSNILYCPRTIDQRCPICEETRMRYNKGKDIDKEIGSKIRARKQYLYNIIDRGSDKPTDVKVYISGKKVWGKIMSYYFDEEYGILDDVDNGYDFKLIKKSQGDYPNYDDSRPFKNPSPLSEDPAEVKEILSNLKDLSSLVEYKSYDELLEILERFLLEEYGEEPLIKTRKVFAGAKAQSETREEKPVEAEAASSKQEVADKKDEEEEEELDDFEKRLEAALAEEDEE